jgi:hypothetical protein
MVSCRRRSPLSESILSRFLSLNHRSITARCTRIKFKCEFGCAPFAFRNVDRLFNHLASPSEGLGKSSGCAHVKSAAPAVRIKHAA